MKEKWNRARQLRIAGTDAGSFVAASQAQKSGDV
jgi:hypothetical protein